MATVNGRRWRLLGPLEVLESGAIVDVGAGKERALLALLLVNRRRAVSIDEVIDELWGEQPPATAHKTVHVYVSRLRKSLGVDVIATRGAAYRIDVSDDAVDVPAFEALAREGRDALAAGDARVTRDSLNAALSLWRGPPLADVDAPFATLEAARLNSIRLAVLEDRLDAELVLGRHRAVLEELQALIDEEPLRERPRAQLMLALYRAGRQVDALAVYRDFRAHLVDELGLEPGPGLRDLERQILAHDPALRRGQEPLPPMRRRRRRGRWIVAAVGAAAAIALGVTATMLSGGTDSVLPEAADTVTIIDPASGRITDRLPAAADPIGVAVGDDAVWVASARDQLLQRIDPSQRRITRTVGIGGTPSAVATAPGAVWVANGADGTVTRVQAATATVSDTLRIRPRWGDDIYARAAPSMLATGAGAVWTNRDITSVSRIAVGDRVPRVGELGPRRSADALALGFGALWVASEERHTLYRVDADRLTVIGATTLPDEGAPALVAGAGAVWVALRDSGRIMRVDPLTLRARHAGKVTGDVVSLAAGAGRIWALSRRSALVSALDPATGRIERTIEVGGRPTALAAGAGAVWVTTTATDPGPPPSGPVRPVQATACQRIYYGGSGAPSKLVVLDVPLQWADTPGIATTTRRDVDAVKDVLRRSGFRAGRLSVGLQVCDDSTKRDGYWTEKRCIANARAYAATPALAGIIGPAHSGCVRAELPVLARAPGGPPPQISYSSTYLGLTRPGPGTAPGEPDVYAAGTRRAFVRIAGPDDAQGVALAQLARRLGTERAYVLDDTTAGGTAAARGAAAALEALGVDTRTAVWNAKVKSYRGLADRIRRAGADTIVLSGCICANGGRLLRDLRAGLPSQTAILMSDTWAAIGPVGVPAPKYVQYLREEAGTAANGAYLTIYGSSLQDLDPMAAARIRRLGPMPSAQDGNPGEVVSAAQAMDVMLQAIATSDGSRTSVGESLRRGRFETLAGEVTFDDRGDVTAPHFVAHRIDAAGTTALGIVVDPELLVRVRTKIGSR